MVTDLLCAKGNIHLQFHSSGNRYVWSKVTSTVHNIIVGKLWIDQVRSSRTFSTVEEPNRPFVFVSCLKLLVPKAFSDCLQSGDIDIVNTTAKDTCRLKFSPYSYFSRDVPRKVSLPSVGSAKTRREGEHRAAVGLGSLGFAAQTVFYL